MRQISAEGRIKGDVKIWVGSRGDWLVQRAFIDGCGWYLPLTWQINAAAVWYQER